MKTTIDLPENLIRAVKVRAAQQGRTVRELVAEYIRNGLNQPTTPGIPIGELGLPLIPMRSDAPLSQMTRDEIIARESVALSDEDSYAG
jgi:hypothetical protein